jgi:hypothetical protein
MGIVKVQSPTIDGASLRSSPHALRLNDLMARLFAGCDFRGPAHVAADKHT